MVNVLDPLFSGRDAFREETEPLKVPLMVPTSLRKCAGRPTKCMVAVSCSDADLAALATGGCPGLEEAAPDDEAAPDEEAAPDDEAAPDEEAAPDDEAAPDEEAAPDGAT